jgi:MoaA/NifB/PqqE/SkfB family radical SAM enzyme
MISDTFCSAPWFAVRLDWDGRYRPCCEIKLAESEFTGRTNYSLNDSTVEEWMSSDYLKYLKESLGNGQKVNECADCWHKEDSNITSLREISNVGAGGTNLDNSWIKLFLKRNDYSKFHLLSADVKLSNVCNFACAMCSPADSSKLFSKWKSQTESEFVSKILDKNPKYFEIISENYDSKKGYDHLKEILKFPIRNLKLLGGEPLLDKQMLTILREVDTVKQSQIHLHFVTNGSQDLLKIAEQLKNYKSLSFSVSLEGIGPLQDFVRAGSNWNQIQENLLAAKSAGIDITIHHTVQAMTILKTNDLLDWCKSNGFVVSFGVLDTPEYLSVSVLPLEVREKAIRHIADNSLTALIEAMPDCSEKYIEFLKFVKWFEKDSISKLADLVPELQI